MLDKRLTLAAILMLWLAGTLLFADAYQIGSGTAGSTLLPANAAYDFNWSRMIYTKAEINAAGLNSAGNLRSLGFYVANSPSGYLMQNQYIYLRHTTATSMDTAYPGTTGFTRVFLGNISFNGTGWCMIDLQALFNWNNTQNIEVLWENRDANYEPGTGPSFRCSDTSPTILAAHCSNQDSFPLSGTPGSLSSLRPNLQISTVSSAAPNPAIFPFPATAAVQLPLSNALSWQSGGGIPTGYKLYLGLTNPPAFKSDLGLANTYTASGLTNGKTYYWKVVPYNAGGETASCPVWTFTTRIAATKLLGTATNPYPAPIAPRYNYSYTQTLYLKTEINTAYTSVKSLAYYWDGSADGPASNSWTIYLGNTTRPKFNSLYDWVPADSLTQVFSGTVNLPEQAGWININLTTIFDNDKTGNLVIAIDENETGHDAPYGSFLGSSVSTCRTLSFGSDTVNPNPAAPPASGSGQSQLSAIANVLLEFTDKQPPVITHLPLLNTPRTDLDYFVMANIKDDTAWNNPISTAQLYYSFNGTSYTMINLTYASNNLYYSFIPVQSLGSQVWYYLKASDNKGNVLQGGINTFQITDPAWLKYVQTFNTPLGYPGYTWGPLIEFDNPFYGTEETLKLTAVDGQSTTGTTASLYVYESETNPMVQGDPVRIFGPLQVTFEPETYTLIDLSAYNITIDAPYFCVSFENMPIGNYFKFNTTIDYNVSYAILGTQMLNFDFYGTWYIGAHIQSSNPGTVLTQPQVNFGINQNNKPQISWNPVPGALYYNVWASSNPAAAWPSGWTRVTTTTGLSYADNSPGAARYFRVTASTTPARD